MPNEYGRYAGAALLGASGRFYISRNELLVTISVRFRHDRRIEVRTPIIECPPRPRKVSFRFFCPYFFISYFSYIFGVDCLGQTKFLQHHLTFCSINGAPPHYSASRREKFFFLLRSKCGCCDKSTKVQSKKKKKNAEK